LLGCALSFPWPGAFHFTGFGLLEEREKMGVHLRSKVWRIASVRLPPSKSNNLPEKPESLAFYRYDIQWETFLADIDYRFEAALAGQ
jgi:hypothetical protein